MKLIFSGALLLALIQTSCVRGELPTEPGATWTRRVSPGKEMVGVACSDERVVAVGWGVQTSPDGLTWGPAGVPHDWRLQRVTWGGTLFVAVGHTVPLATGRQIIAASPDGLRWTERTVPAALDDVAWSGDMFVAVGYRSILTSRDAATWKAHRLLLDGGLSGVTWGGSQFVAVGDILAKGEDYRLGTLIVTSPDGVTWSERSAPGVGLRDVTWSGERFVAVGRNSILTSQDGLTWEAQRAPVEGFDLTGIAWSGSLFAAVGTVQTAGWGTGLVITSPDGVMWTKGRAPARRVEPAAVAWCGTRFVAVGKFRRGWFADYTSELILTSP